VSRVAIRTALKGREVRRGQSCTLHVTATPQAHEALLSAADTLAGEGASPAGRKAYRLYQNRVDAARTMTR
jgi:putative DNA-invertase from lambdoid prophage Rac